MPRKNIILFAILIVALNISLPFYSVISASPNLQDAFKTGGYADKVAEGAGYSKQVDFVKIIGNVISVALSILGVVFLFLIMYGGFKWMTARGNEQQVEKAKDTIQPAIIGLIIVLAAYAITYFLVKTLGTGLLTNL